MLIPKPPLFVIDGYDIAVFDSIEKVVGHLEPIDVANNEQDIFDSDGRRIELAVVKTNGFFFGESEVVVFKAIEAEPVHAGELAKRLVAFLGYLGINQDWLLTASLPELVKKTLEQI
jgi:hypothetical protein